MCLKFLQFLVSSSSFSDCALPTLASTNSADSEIQQDSWHHEQRQRHRYIFALSTNSLFQFSARY